MSDFTWTETPNDPATPLVNGPFHTLHFTAISAIEHITVDFGVGVEECVYRDGAFRGPYAAASSINIAKTIGSIYRTGGWSAPPTVYAKIAASPSSETYSFYFPSYTNVAVDAGDEDEAGITGGFGTGPFGSMPFGSAFSSAPVSLSIVYGEAVSVDTIRIHLNMEAVVNDVYKNPANYNIVDANGKAVEIRSVMWPVASDSYPWVQLHVRNLTESQTYTVGASNLLSRKGFEIDDTVQEFTYVRTKVDSVVSSIPQIYDVTATSNLRAMLTAIGYEDNIISGSPDGLEENV